MASTHTRAETSTFPSGIHSAAGAFTATRERRHARASVVFQNTSLPAPLPAALPAPLPAMLPAPLPAPLFARRSATRSAARAARSAARAAARAAARTVARTAARAAARTAARTAAGTATRVAARVAACSAACTAARIPRNFARRRSPESAKQRAGSEQGQHVGVIRALARVGRRHTRARSTYALRARRSRPPSPAAALPLAAVVAPPCRLLPPRLPSRLRCCHRQGRCRRHTRDT